MDIVRIVVGVAVVAASGLVLSAAIRRVVRGVALLFGGAVAFVVGGYLILSGLWRVIRSRRRSRDGPRRVLNTVDQADL